VIVLGGAMNVEDAAEHPWIDEELEMIRTLLDRGTPLLGVCLGSQLLATAAGGRAERAPEPEIGWFGVDVGEAGASDPLIGPLAPGFEALQWHSYRSILPAGAIELASSPVSPQAFRIGSSAWGIQFHAEVSRPDAEHWIHDYESDPDAIRIGIEPGRLLAETMPRIDAWNELGRDLCARFLEVAARRHRD
jgi:GMP synthase (glutamine-hydrolysing)